MLSLVLFSASFSSKSFTNYRDFDEVVNTEIEEVLITAKRPEHVTLPWSGIATSVFVNQIYHESRGRHIVNDSLGNPKIIQGPLLKNGERAKGIAQFLPSTWNYLKKIKAFPKYFSIDNESHQRAAQRLYMNRLANYDYGIKYNKTILALASYNWGCQRVKTLVKRHGNDWETFLPKKVKKYINLITS